MTKPTFVEILEEIQSIMEENIFLRKKVLDYVLVLRTIATEYDSSEANAAIEVLKIYGDVE